MTKVKPLGRGKFAPQGKLEKYVLERFAAAIAHITGVPYLSERGGKVYVRTRLDCGDRIINSPCLDGKGFPSREDALIAIMETEIYIEHISHDTVAGKLRALLK